jgi:succinate dehydrogenase / fumarate reductase cytochrome b subunit
MPDRPLSPFLSVYKFKYTLVTSISNRFAGLTLSLGLLMLAYWLVALAGGPHAYARAHAVLSRGVFKPVYFLLLAAFVFHLIAGIRHLVWDCGVGLERATARRSAWIVVGVSVVLTLILAYFLFGARMHTR